MPDPAFQKTPWVAKRLGIHRDTFAAKRRDLERAGFPRPDPVMGQYLVADVEAWIENRRTIAQREASDNRQGVNLDAV